MSFLFKLLTVILLFFAVGITMALLMRLARIQQKIADRHKELADNSAELQRHKLEIERLRAALEVEEARNNGPEIKS